MSRRTLFRAALRDCCISVAIALALWWLILRPWLFGGLVW